MFSKGYKISHVRYGITIENISLLYQALIVNSNHNAKFISTRGNGSRQTDNHMC